MIDIIIQETVNDVEITVNQTVITVNVTRTTGGGGGGVESVTGDLVDNTDPLNPIINTPTLAQTLAEDNKTNDIPIVSNNGYSAINVNDDYLQIGYDNGDGSSNVVFDGISAQIYGLILASIYSGDVIKLDAGTAIIIGAPAVDIDTSILNYNSEEVATQPWVTSQGYGTTETLAETLAEDNKTNNIPIVSNNGKALVIVNDDYVTLNYGIHAALSMSDTDVQLYSDVPVAFDSTVSTDFNTPVLNYNNEEIATQPYADAKVADDLTASTTVAPSKTAVNTALALKQDKGNYRKLVAVDAGNTTHTGTLTETIVSSILIPANSLDALCDLFFSYDYVKSTGNATTIKVYLNTANNLTGATLFASYNAGSFRNAGFFRKMLLRGTNLDTQASTANLLNNYIGDILFAPSNVITLNPAVNNYILVTITLSNTGDVFTTKRTILEKLNLVP